MCFEAGASLSKYLEFFDIEFVSSIERTLVHSDLPALPDNGVSPLRTRSNHIETIRGKT